jgi:hypothetical protein
VNFLELVKLSAEQNEKINKVVLRMLTFMAAFSPKDSFADFKLESLLELAKLYRDDFSHDQLKDLAHKLPIYIDNVRADERFSGLNTITELAKLMVDTKKHLAFPLVYQFLKLVLVLPVATAGLFAWTENKRLKVLLADLCWRKTLLAG